MQLCTATLEQRWEAVRKGPCQMFARPPRKENKKPKDEENHRQAVDGKRAKKCLELELLHLVLHLPRVGACCSIKCAIIFVRIGHTSFCEHEQEEEHSRNCKRKEVRVLDHPDQEPLGSSMTPEANAAGFSSLFRRLSSSADLVPRHKNTARATSCDASSAGRQFNMLFDACQVKQKTTRNRREPDVDIAQQAGSHVRSLKEPWLTVDYTRKPALDLTLAFCPLCHRALAFYCRTAKRRTFRPGKTGRQRQSGLP